VFLGQVNPLDTELTETKPLWLGVKVGTDAEMSPRVELTPGPYSLILMNTITVKDGNVGINISSPQIKLHVHGYPQIRISETNKGFWDIKSGNAFYIDDDGVNRVRIDANGKFNVLGTLYVSGGTDLAEPFDMTDIANLELGDVVVIDPANPLHVTKSTTAYDKTVAGIVSSSTQAGYVAGSRSDGTSDKPVALVGRVLCNVSAENGAITIGDLLTTSNTPGHAMKATDADKRQGAILGKALQAFDAGTGQIMVLVTLQ